MGAFPCSKMLELKVLNGKNLCHFHPEGQRCIVRENMVVGGSPLDILRILGVEWQESVLF